MREGKVSDSNPIGRVARNFMRKNARLAPSKEMGGRLASGPSLGLKSFFVYFLKANFVFSIKIFLQAGGITKLPVDNLFLQAPSAGGSPIRLWKEIGNRLSSGSVY